jgi:hypothetical protein
MGGMPQPISPKNQNSRKHTAMKAISIINSFLTNLIYGAILAGLILAFANPGSSSSKQGAAAAPPLAGKTARMGSNRDAVSLGIRGSWA